MFFETGSTYAVSGRRKLTIRMNSTTLPLTPYGVPHNDVGSSHFLWTHFVAPHGSNPDYPHPLCLCGDKGINLGYGIRSEERTNTARYLTTGVAQLTVATLAGGYCRYSSSSGRLRWRAISRKARVRLSN